MPALRQRGLSPRVSSLHPAGTKVNGTALGGERKERACALKRKPEPRQRRAARCDGIHDPGRGLSQPKDERIAPGQFLFDPPYVVVLFQAGKLRRCGDRVVDAAKFVHDARGLGVGAGPHAALRETVDLLGPALSRVRDVLDEGPVGVLDRSLED